MIVFLMSSQQAKECKCDKDKDCKCGCRVLVDYK